MNLRDLFFRKRKPEVSLQASIPALIMEKVPEEVKTPTPPLSEKVADPEISSLSKLPLIGASFNSIVNLKKSLLSYPTLDWSGIVLHHSATKDTTHSDFEAIRKYHKEVHGWNEIGYHFVIEDSPQLVVKLGRPLSVKGAHAVGFNSTSIGICVVGNYDQDKPEPPKWIFCIDFVKMLMEWHGIPKSKVLGHRETYPLRGVPVEKQCPGIRWDMNLFRTLLP